MIWLMLNVVKEEVNNTKLEDADDAVDIYLSIC